MREGWAFQDHPDLLRTVSALEEVWSNRYLVLKKLKQKTVKHQSRVSEGESGWILGFLYRICLLEKKPILCPGEDAFVASGNFSSLTLPQSSFGVVCLAVDVATFF